MGYLAKQQIGQGEHYAELAEMTAFAAQATIRATYAEGMRNSGRVPIELAPTGVLGPAWLKDGLLGDAGAGTAGLEFAMSVAGTGGLGLSGGMIFAAAWDATTSNAGCH